jgi:hypothetical protein
MVVRVVQNLPPADRAVFVVHPDHAAAYPVERVLRQHVPGAVVVVAPGLTAGQACSVQLAYDHLDPDDAVLVAACDSTQIYDPAKHAALAADPAIDAIIWAFRGDPRVLVKPEWYGWVKEDAGRVTGVSVKKPISPTPLKDAVVSGTFWFRTARLMAVGIDALVAADRRVNNEFYLDSVPDVLAAAGRRVAVFEMDKYIGWGTPDDLEDYLRWERHFAARAA